MHGRTPTDTAGQKKYFFVDIWQYSVIVIYISDFVSLREKPCLFE